MRWERYPDPQEDLKKKKKKSQRPGVVSHPEYALGRSVLNRRDYNTVLNPFRASEPFPILNPSNCVPKNGFPVEKELMPLNQVTWTCCGGAIPMASKGWKSLVMWPRTEMTSGC